MKKTVLMGVIGACLALAPHLNAMTVVPHPLPLDDKAYEGYRITVNGVPVPVVDSYRDKCYAHFSYSALETATLAVAMADAIQTYSLSPRRYDLKGIVEGKRLSFTITGQKYLKLRVDGLKECFIFADPLEVDAPTPDGPTVINLARYHVDNRGRTPCTVPLNQAISDAFQSPDRKIVYVPAGKYTSATVYLKAGVTLYLASGALLQATREGTDLSRDNPGGTYERLSFISAYHAPGAKIRGRGVIDGNGDYYRSTYPWPKRTIKDHAGHDVDTQRANNVQFSHCDNFLLEGVISRFSSSWNTILHYCDGGTVEHYKVFQTLNYKTDDALDIDSCVRTEIRNSFFMASDDTICLKTCGTDGGRQKISPDGTKRDMRDLVIRNNVIYSDQTAGLKYGYNESDAAKISHILFEGNDILKSREGVQLRIGRTSILRDFVFRNNRYEASENQNYRLITSRGREVRFIDEIFDSFGKSPSEVELNQVEFRNLTIAGKKIRTADAGRFRVTGRDVTFTATP